ncbi:MAG TPA: hypothetical protein VG518_00960 [Solirubrobacterales bacterium]|nr:hypothetical protein [Solirubrobacterales bacterium]
MRAKRRGWLLALASALAAAAPGADKGCGGGSACAAGPPRAPGWVQVEGGEESWHSESRFGLSWESAAQAGQTVLATHYRVLDATGAVAVAEKRIDPVTHVANTVLPGGPGTYTFQVWWEGEGGLQGLPATAQLRFDNARPGGVEPPPNPGWIGRNAIPYTASLGHPTTPLPLSGIRGYAVSVDAWPSASPCAAPDRCTDAETVLRGGIWDDRFAIPALREGTNYLHVVAVSGSGMRSAEPGVAVLKVDKSDPVTGLKGAPAGWTSQSVNLTATAVDALSGMAASGSAGPFTAISVDGGAPRTAFGDTVSAAVIGEGVHTVAYYARDAAGNVNDGGGANGLRNAPPNLATIRIDRSPPKASFENFQNPQDPELIEARVQDAQSGPDPSRGRIAFRPAGSDGGFEALPTEVTEAGLRARWDSDRYPSGEYEFQATAYDAAGNALTTGRRSNGVAMVLYNPLKVPTELRAGFGGRVLAWHRCAKRSGKKHCREEVMRGFGRRPRERFVPYGRSIPFGGRLVANRRSPLAGMPVEVIERFDAGTKLVERVTTVKTGDDGFFLTRLAPGPSREVSVAFRGTPTMSRASGSSSRLGVRTGVWMRASTASARIGGRPILFSGVVKSGEAEIPPDGKTVELQFRLPHQPWSEFRTVQTDPQGRFRYAYRFTDDDSRGIAFEFRALAVEQSGWAYEAAGSKPLVVRGR